MATVQSPKRSRSYRRQHAEAAKLNKLFRGQLRISFEPGCGFNDSDTDEVIGPPGHVYYCSVQPSHDWGDGEDHLYVHDHKQTLQASLLSELRRVSAFYARLADLMEKGGAQ